MLAGLDGLLLDAAVDRRACVDVAPAIALQRNAHCLMKIARPPWFNPDHGGLGSAVT